MSLTTRYGSEALSLEVRSEVLDLQLAHRSVRKFASGEVTDDHLQAMVAAAQSAPTSSNLQPWSVVVVRDPQRKAVAHAACQRFIEEAPSPGLGRRLSRARRLAARPGAVVDAADYLETTIIGFVDTALAAQNAVVAAESLGLGTVFVGAIRNHPDKVAAELGLPPHAVATFGLAVGVPDPTESAGIKPRLPQAAVVHHETYDAEAADAHIPGYDARLAAYNQRYGLPDGGWSGRVLKRLAGPESMAGRHRLREVLDGLGLPSR